MGRAIFLLLALSLLDVSIAHIQYRRRPQYSFFTNSGDKVPILNKPGHRRVARAAMPALRPGNSGQPSSVLPATQVQSIDKSGYCQTWSQQHYRSFDGKLFDFHGACTYTLVTDCLDFSFHVYVENDLRCQETKSNNTCSRSVLIDNGNPSSMIYLRPGGSVFYENEELTLPTKAGGLVLERIAHYVLATSGLGFTILFDGVEAITVYITSESLGCNTCGLCGVHDNNPSNDFRTPSGSTADDAYTFGLSWKGMDQREPDFCPDVPTVPLRCTQYANFETTAERVKAEYTKSACSQLMHSTFVACHQVVDPEPYITACEQDVCACEMVEQSDGSLGNDCKCAAFTAYTQECARRGFQVSWRSADFCPFQCPPDKIYDGCGSACNQKGCSTAIADCETDGTVGCIEGCHCPDGTYRSTSGECVNANQCFCAWQGSEYEPGEKISDGCNECECTDGKWQCTQNDCGGMCQVSGYGHYHTFDSYDYDFAGTCTYTLVKNCWRRLEGYMVNIENAECGKEGSSCVKAVVLQDGADEVRLRRGHQVLANGQEVTEFPVTVGNIFVNQPTQHQTAAVMSNGLTIIFDGNNRVVVMADERHINSTCGLCGTYNNNQRDDFYTEAGDTESNPSSFANKWKIGSSCADAEDDQATDPCDLYSQKSLTAEQECYRLYIDDAFAPCRQFVDPEIYYESCRRDVCNCENGDSCKCDIFAMYATQCSLKGVIINWRSEVPGCGIKCEKGLVYSACHPMCSTTCNALSSNSVCEDACVEGCACPDGSLMTPNGACVAPENCGCVDPDTGKRFGPGERIEKGCGGCTCKLGAWVCEELDCPQSACGMNEDYVRCVSPCVKTCANMHEFEDCSAATCYGGCACTEFTVWNGTSCVLPTSCPCHHGGHSYEEGDVIQTDECHSCTCENSKWKCRENHCHGVCTAWGDPHYKTFDGKLFDFQGDCDYVLVTDSVSQASGIAFFHVVIGNIPCGTSGVTCTKSITFTIGTGENQEKLQLVRGKPVPQSAGSFQISLVGSHVYVHTKIGVTLLWDQGTWIQVKIDPMYKGKVGGLCGNFNDLVSDDFLSPAGGLPETSSIDFGNSWKVHEYCPRPSHLLHPCIQNPFRRAWAMRQCSVLKSELFAPCHCEVSYLPYYTRCVYDTCGCDYGGDCECLCTAISTYAQECNAHGVPIKWRSNDLCPIQCDGCREYDPCIPVCNVCGHEDRWDENGECPDTCVEGCSCPDGQFHQDGECVEECITTTPSTTTAYISTTPPWSTTPETITTPQFEMCICTGYGDPHYVDFNGNHFDHQGICTYILSEEAADSPVYSVYVHNVECAELPGTSCTKDIEIVYDGYSVKLLSSFSADGAPLVVVDDIPYKAPVDFLPSFQVICVGLDIIYQAPEIGLEVRFVPWTNYYFSVEVPKARFYDSTFGLCGNCGKNETTCETDDNCCDHVYPPEDRDKCGCDETVTPCPPDEETWDWCRAIYTGPGFKRCHDVVDPAPYFINCLYDNCFADNPNCWSFEAYATECANQGVCLDWRQDDFCPMDCEEPFEYRQCVCPAFPYGCDPLDPIHGERRCPTEPVSGCFCPVGTRPVGDTCVPCSTPTVPTTTPPRDPCEKCLNFCVWTPWCNDEAPGRLASDALVEEELLSDVQHYPGFPAICIIRRDVECRTVDTHMYANETDDAATCDPDIGLQCRNGPLRPPCRDYEIRFLCCGTTCPPACWPKLTTPETTTPHSPPPTITLPETTTTGKPPTTKRPPDCHKCLNFCVWTPWCNDEAPGRLASDALVEEELLSDVQHHPGFPAFCIIRRDVECRTVDTHIYANETNDAATCDPDIGLQCRNGPLRPPCRDYEIRFLCCGTTCPPACWPKLTTPETTTQHSPPTKTTPETTTTEKPPTKRPPDCHICLNFCVWTPWCNDEAPGRLASDALVEEELLSDVQHYPGFPAFCIIRRDVECRTVDTHMYANETDDAATCDPDIGLQCRNGPLRPPCRDYEIRFLCCGTTCPPACWPEPTTKRTPPPPTTVTFITDKTTSRPPTPPPPPPPPECGKCLNFCVWTPWCNDEAPGRLASDALVEEELLSDVQHYPGFPAFCIIRRDVECRTVDTHMYANETDDAATCDPDIGLQCRNGPLRPPCRDYEIRFLCCGTTCPPKCRPTPPPPPPPTTTPPVIIETTTPKTRPPPTPKPPTPPGNGMAERLYWCILGVPMACRKSAGGLPERGDGG
ncbi:mucin-5B-like [Diadema antillarum]|uniref:mucin-5B-like n=1 Tax=Diadema antillarum TaxID=105358 RepID=UPI003A8C3596